MAPFRVPFEDFDWRQFFGLPTNIKHKIANPADRTRSQDEEELITLDDQEVENISELTFLDSKD